MKSRADLAGGTRKIEAFQTHLAVEAQVAPSTQNQALNALVFLYERVLEQPLEGRIDAVRASRPPRVPEVLTPEEARRVIALLEGAPQLVVKILYGSGLRLLEALWLRVKDVDFKMLSVTVRGGKGGKDRVTPLAVSLAGPLQEHLARVRGCTRRTGGTDWRACGCPLRWSASIRTRGGNGSGNGCFLRGVCRWIRGPGWRMGTARTE